MIEIDKKLREDLEDLATSAINSLSLKVLNSKNPLKLIDDTFRNLLSDTTELVIKYLDDEYFDEIKEYKNKLLSYVIIYIDELKSNFLMSVRKQNAGALDMNQYTKKVSSIPKTFAFYLSTAVITNTTALINFAQIKNAYQKGLISYDAYEILKDKFLGKENKKIIKNVDDLTYMFVAYIDKKTCRGCKGLDGKKFTFNQLLKGINAPPLHPNCRCEMIILGEK